MQKGQPFRKSLAIFQAIAGLMPILQGGDISASERQKLLASIPEYRSSGKGRGQSPKAEKGKTARIKRASLVKRNLKKRK